MTRTASWQVFAAGAPALAATGRRLLYQSDAHASAFLATVSRAGTPRLHPVFPVLTGDALWLFIVQMSPKYRDLLAAGRFALHSLPPPSGGEEFALQGRAEEVDDTSERARVVAATQGRQGVHEFEKLFRCQLSTALHTHWTDWGTAASWPRYAKWHA